MIITPKVKGFICTTAHPAGCKENVNRQIEYVKKNGRMDGAKKVLIIGASTGYGLATRIASTYGCGASTIGVMFEKKGNERRTATPGWYNTEAFETRAREDGYYAESLNGDAFSLEMKQQVIDRIKKDLGKIDMVIYSLAAPKRTTLDGITYSSVLKTVESDFTNKSLNLKTNEILDATITPATPEEVQSTIKVMGGEDWKDWMHMLAEADVIEDNAITLAYSYIGPELTYPVYYNGTIGLAKQHLLETSKEITKMLSDKNISAYIAINKALVTQASSAIPIVPLYMAILYRVMKDAGLHEGCIEQMDRLFREKLNNNHPIVDDENRIRLDDYEMKPEIQKQVMEYWNRVTSDNVTDLADLEGYWNDFYQMFGFHFDNVNYDEDIQLL